MSVNESKTKELLNIDVSTLTSGSGVRVYWVCDNCGIEKLKPYRDCVNSTGLCSKCSSVKQGAKMGNTFGKAQAVQGKCLYCDTPIRSQHVTCPDHRKDHLRAIYSGSNNPAYVGRCDVRCACGNKKSFSANMCRKCSFESGQRSGPNNGRWVEDRGKIISAKIARNILSNTLKVVNQKKNGRTAKMLGYTFNDLKVHLESQFEPWMNWNNRGMTDDGGYVWHVDHIIPVAVLVKLGIDDPSIINALWNLRPLRSDVNIKKSDKIDDLARQLAREKLNIDL